MDSVLVVKIHDVQIMIDRHAMEMARVVSGPGGAMHEFMDIFIISSVGVAPHLASGRSRRDSCEFEFTSLSTLLHIDSIHKMQI
jgi:hypothetical protein